MRSPSRKFRYAAILPLLIAMGARAEDPKPAAAKAAAPKPAAAPAAKTLLPFKATEKTLANGLKVIVVPTGFPNLVSIHIPVQTGSRNEVEPGKSGFAHFFEHMMFRGTKNLSADQYQEIVKRAGANGNAYTSDDFTNYHLTFAKEDLPEILRIEADRFQNLSYDEAAFKTEARAVLGEYNKNSASPVRQILEVQRDKAYTTHTYKHTTMGFLKDIEDMPNQFAYSKTFFDRWYRPEYTTLIIAGDVVPEKVFPLVEKSWGSWKRGSFKVAIPKEPAPKAPVYAHVPWTANSLPWVTVAFRAPAFSDKAKDAAAMDLLFSLYFGQTSDLYKKLVEDEQKVDQMFADSAADNADPGLATVFARVKKLDDTVYVRDQILTTFARAKRELVNAGRLDDARSNARYSLLRGLDNTDAIAGLLARFVRYDRSFGTLNRFYAVTDTITPQDLRKVAEDHFVDAGLVVTTLAKETMPAAMTSAPSLASFAKAAPEAGSGSAADLSLILQKSALPQLNVKVQFLVGSVHDPKGKEGLAELAAAMISEAGSKDRKTDEISKILFPMSASFSAQVDRELTTFTGAVHRDNWQKNVDTDLPQLLTPGYRDEDFARLKEAQLNALKQDLKGANEEELGKERLQATLFAGTPYGHPSLGTASGISSITLADVKDFIAKAYTRAAMRVGVSGDAPDELVARLKKELGTLPAGPALDAVKVTGKRPSGYEVEIIEKDTRATAVSFGLPIEVTRSHPDFAALSVATSWLGEHRSSNSHLFQRIREVRGMNYGDYAYIEAFPGGMFRFVPSPGTARRSQIFEVWIRPVTSIENAHMAVRIALHELENLVDKGMSKEDFESTRNFLMKYVYIKTSTQDQQLGYALASDFYKTEEYTKAMRDALGKLTLEDVNRAVKRHLSSKDLSFVFVTKDAQGLKERLVSDQVSAVKYDGEKPKELLDEDKVIGARKLGLKAENVRITPIEKVFSE